MPEDEDQPNRPDYNDIADLRGIADSMDHAALIIPKDGETVFVNVIDAEGHSTKTLQFSLDKWDEITGVLDAADVEYDIYEG